MAHQVLKSGAARHERKARGALLAGIWLVLATIAPAQQAQPPVSSVDEADPLVGTAPLDQQALIGNAPPPGEPAYSGQTSPGARLPHSSVEAAPVNTNVELQYPSGVAAPYYHPNPVMIGFTAGGGLTYGANAKPMLMPVVGDWTVPPAYTEAPYDKASEAASPGYYRVDLMPQHVRVELTATRWTGMMRFTFPTSDRANVIVNLPRNGGSVEVAGNRMVRGIATSNRDNSADGSYFIAEFSRPFADFGTFRKTPGEHEDWGLGDKDVQPSRRMAEGSYAGAFVTFRTTADEPVLVKIAHGHSYAEAAGRLRAENPDWNFDRVHAAARADWANLLNRVQVTGGTQKQRRLFYSTLFQSLASPRLIAKAGDTLTGRDGKPHVAAHDRYSPVPYWDTARNQLVLLELMEPKLVADVMQSELDGARERGFMNTSFHGDHAVLMYLGAMERGIPFDYAAAYEYLRRNAFDPQGPRGYLAEYIAHGWIADEIPSGNPSPPYADGKAGAATTLEYAWDDHALGVMANKLNRGDDRDALLRRASDWHNVFDPRVGFVRGRTADGRWIAPFDPEEPYYNFMMKEASGWSTLWLVPHDVGGLIQALGGRAAFNAKLDRFFATPYHPSGICRDCTGVIGQYVQGNQPDQHAAYLYAWSGQPWKTQALVRRILDRLYGSDAAGLGYPGMDDQGSTSSWYVMSAMGFYPVDPSTSVYVIGSPIFDRVRLTMGNGRVLEIVARNVSAANQYIQSAMLNGRPWNKPWFSHADIANGATLELVMGPAPNPAWGSAPDASPPSMTAAGH